MAEFMDKLHAICMQDVRDLIASGDVNIRQKDGLTSLHDHCSDWGAEEWRVDCARELIAAGAKVNLRCQEMGKTALFYANERQALKMIDFLLEVGADPDIPDKKGRTPLVAAIISAGDSDFDPAAGVAAVKKLLACGANPNLRDCHDWTPLHVAVRECLDRPFEDPKHWWRQIIEALVAAGADFAAVTTPSKNEKDIGWRGAFPLAKKLTAFQAAVIACDKELVSLFLDMGEDPNQMTADKESMFELADANRTFTTPDEPEEIHQVLRSRMTQQAVENVFDNLETAAPKSRNNNKNIVEPL